MLVECEMELKLEWVRIERARWCTANHGGGIGGCGMKRFRDRARAHRGQRTETRAAGSIEHVSDRQRSVCNRGLPGGKDRIREDEMKEKEADGEDLRIE